MERHTVFSDWKTQHGREIHCSQIDLLLMQFLSKSKYIFLIGTRHFFVQWKGMCPIIAEAISPNNKVRGTALYKIQKYKM